MKEKNNNVEVTTDNSNNNVSNCTEYVCKGLIGLNNDFQIMSTCIENHIQTLDNNTKKIEKEFNKIKEKIGCNGDFIVGDNILNSINEIKLSNEKIKNIIGGDCINNRNDETFFEIALNNKPAMILLGFGLLTFAITGLYNFFIKLWYENKFCNKYLDFNFAISYIDKVLLPTTLVFIALFYNFIYKKNNSILIKKVNHLISLTSFFAIVYFTIWYLNKQ